MLCDTYAAYTHCLCLNASMVSMQIRTVLLWEADCFRSPISRLFFMYFVDLGFFDVFILTYLMTREVSLFFYSNLTEEGSLYMLC